MNRPDPILWLEEARERHPDRWWYVSAIPGGGTEWQAREIAMAMKRGEVEARPPDGGGAPGYRYIKREVTA